MRLPEPHLVIVDETFYQRGCRHETVPLSQLRQKLGTLPGLDPQLDTACGLIADALEGDRPLLRELRDAGITADYRRQAANLVHVRRETLPQLDGGGDEAVAALLEKREHAAGRKVRDLLEVLADELCCARDEANGVYRHGGTVHIAWHIRLLLRDRNTLLLDASGRRRYGTGVSARSERGRTAGEPRCSYHTSGR
jgi:hypothetical protein